MMRGIMFRELGFCGKPEMLGEKKKNCVNGRCDKWYQSPSYKTGLVTLCSLLLCAHCINLIL